MNLSPDKVVCKSFISLAVFKPTPGRASAICLAPAKFIFNLVSTGKVSLLLTFASLSPLAFNSALSLSSVFIFSPVAATQGIKSSSLTYSVSSFAFITIETPSPCWDIFSTIPPVILCWYNIIKKNPSLNRITQ